MLRGGEGVGVMRLLGPGAEIERCCSVGIDKGEHFVEEGGIVAAPGGEEGFGADVVVILDQVETAVLQELIHVLIGEVLRSEKGGGVAAALEELRGGFCAEVRRCRGVELPTDAGVDGGDDGDDGERRGAGVGIEVGEDEAVFGFGLEVWRGGIF